MGLDLNDALFAIANSKNYNFVKRVDDMICYKSQPFYVSFGHKNDILKNLAFITDADESYVSRISVDFFLDPEKLLKGIIISVPDCINEMDSLFYSIAFETNVPIRYNCELMEQGKYCLRKNNENIIQLFDKKPTAEEIWEIIQRNAHHPQTDQLMALLSASPDENEWFFMLFNEKDEQLLNHWLGTTEYNKTFFDKDGVKYVLLSGDKPARYILRYSSQDNKLLGVQYSDMSVAITLD